MKLYDAISANTKRVRIFIAEKGIAIPRITLELGKDTRDPEFLKLNALGEVPALELDDGQILTESAAICRYLEHVFPKKPLMGTLPIERGRIDMWRERMFHQLFMPYGLLARHRLPLFADVVAQHEGFADSQYQIIPKQWVWLDREMADGRPFIAGSSFSFADVEGMVVLMLADAFQIKVPPVCKHVGKWEIAMRKRPSWAA